ncbi:MAG: CDP-glycerol glycerophosphotransferase, partial [Stenotrophomonas koreensis]
MADYLLFATERYALPILAPLAAALHAQGHRVFSWFEDGAAGGQLDGVTGIGLQQALALRPR